MSEEQKGLAVRGFMNPTNIKEGMELAGAIAKSDLAPKDFKDKPANVLIAMQMGFEVGLSPMQAIQSIAVINGRPSIWGDAMLAICQNHPAFESIDENQSNATVGVCVVKRRGMEPQRREFSVEDAKKAGLFGKQGPWQSAPARMLKLRARAFALRDTFADALRGFQSAEEQRDIVDTTATVTPAADSPLMPKRASEAAPKMSVELGAHGPVVSVSEDATAPRVPSDRCITLTQAKALFAVAKASGKTDETVKAYIQSCGFKGSLEITESRYPEILAWADGKVVGVDVEPAGIGE